MKNTLVTNFIEQVLAEVKKQNVQSADLVINTNQGLTIKTSKAILDEYKVASSNVAGLRIIHQGKVGLSYTEQLTEENIKPLIKMALDNSQLANYSEYEKIDFAEKAMNGENFNESEMLDGNLIEKIEFTQKMESEVLSHDGVVACPYHGFSESVTSSYYANHKGVQKFQSDYFLSCYTSALMKKDDISALSYYSAYSRKLKQLDSKLCINESLKHAKNFLAGKAISTGKYSVIFSPDSLASLFNAFSGFFSAKRAKDGSNPFFQKLGTKTFSDLLTIKDDPYYKPAFFQYPWDSEGRDRQVLAIAEKGIFTGAYHNSVTAKYFKTENNARAMRSPRGALGVSGTNTVISAGNDSQIWHGKVLEIQELTGTHSGTNAISGDFSLPCTGYLKENGQTISVVRYITIAGNFLEMLSNIEAVGTEIKNDQSFSFFSPEILFKNISVAGL